MVHLGDEVILKRMCEGDKAAFAELYRRHCGKIQGFLLHRNCRQEIAEEILQEVFIAAWEKADQYHAGRGTPLQWIYVIARNRLFDCWRRSRKWEEISGTLMLSEEADIESPESINRMFDALKTLPPDERELVQAVFLEGQSYSELSRKMKQPLHGIRRRALRILEKLKTQLLQEAGA